MTPTEFQLCAAWARQHIGVTLHPSSSAFLANKLAPILRGQGFRSVTQLLDALMRKPEPSLFGSLVDALTVHETSFFRDPDTFECLRTRILPELVSARADVRRLNIWSAACAGGQEAFSLAMLLQDEFPELAAWEVRLIATDVSPARVARCREGYFTASEVRRGLTRSQRERFFESRGRGYQATRALRERIETRTLNVLLDPPPGPHFDLILLRNVLIYFDDASKARALENTERCLAPDGFLLLGGTESTINLDSKLAPAPGTRAGTFRPLPHPHTASAPDTTARN